jgi:hypothetical protein
MLLHYDFPLLSPAHLRVFLCGQQRSPVLAPSVLLKLLAYEREFVRYENINLSLKALQPSNP